MLTARTAIWHIQVVEAFKQVDALVHHVPVGEREEAEVLSESNIKRVVDKVRDWEAVVRGRSQPKSD